MLASSLITVLRPSSGHSSICNIDKCMVISKHVVKRVRDKTDETAGPAISTTAGEPVISAYKVCPESCHIVTKPRSVRPLVNSKPNLRRILIYLCVFLALIRLGHLVLTTSLRK